MTKPALFGQAAALRAREKSPRIGVGRSCIHEQKAGIEGDVAAQSLRAGFITSAASTRGVSEADIQKGVLASLRRDLAWIRWLRQRLRGRAACRNA
jgi:hypothetical protein